jgi:hypothetical protein
MKKNIVILIASLIITFSAAYANGNEKNVPETVTSAFTSDFSHAGNVKWELLDGYYKASFNEHGKTLFAFYTADAEFMGIASNLLSDRLPVSLQSEIKEKYSEYWISDLFHFNIKNTPGYFITLENADQKIMLKAEENKSWSFYSIVKKY